MADHKSMNVTQIAQEYRQQVVASGDKAEMAAIADMPDAFVAAIAVGDYAAATKALEGEA